jgi:sugar phosphate isomerase/epimerase
MLINQSIKERKSVYKNLNANILGVTGRQSELIELAMTYGFQGLDFDAVDLLKRVQRTDFEKASRFLTSSKMRASGFEIPIDLDADDAEFEKAVAGLAPLAEAVGKLGGTSGFLRVPAATDRLAFPEYFETIRKRIDRVADTFAQAQVLVGLDFSTTEEDRAGKQFKFVQDVSSFLALYKACTSSGVGLVIDSYDWTVGGGTFEQLAEIPGNKIAAVRISDVEQVPGIADSTRAQRLIAGSKGTIDNVRLVQLLHKSGYEGPITSFADSSNFAGTKRDAIVARTQDALDQVLTGAGLPTFTRRPETVIEASSTFHEEVGLEA